MMIRLAAAALVAIAAPAVAQVSVHDTHTEHGATAGRSPHKTYHPVAAREACGPVASHGQPAGRTPHHAVPISVAHCGDGASNHAKADGATRD